MTIRLRNQNNPEQVLNLTHQAWYSLLDLAEAYGWRPVGSVHLPGDEFWELPETYDPAGMRYSYPGDDADWEEDYPQVMLEDALTLADALERAFVDYEPLHVPSSFFLFAPEDSHLEQRPSIGAIMETARFCRLGAFTLEPYTRP